MYRVDIVIYEVDEDNNEQELFIVGTEDESAVNAINAAETVAVSMALPLDPSEEHRESVEEGFYGGREDPR